MMQRLVLLGFLSFLFVPFSLLSGQDGNQQDDYVASPFAVTPEEKEQLLTKAENALRWFRSLGRTERAENPSEEFRKHISPMELMQAAAILKDLKQVDMSRMIREMLPYCQPSSSECFEIEERLGDEVLKSFQEEKEFLTGENTIDATNRIKQGAETFLKEELNPAEKFALLDPPETPEQLMKTVDLLATSGRPVLVRYYLRRFLNTEMEPKDYADIVQKIGSQRLMQIAGNKHFDPQGAEAVAKIFEEAKKYWQAPDTVSEALDGLDLKSLAKSGQSGQLAPESLESLQALWRGGRVSIKQLLDKLAQTDDENEANDLLAALLSSGEDVKEALSESLRSENPRLLKNAANGLTTALSTQEMFLLYPLLYSKSSAVSDELRKKIGTCISQKLGRKPSATEAVATLYGRAVDYCNRNRSLKVDSDGYVRFWNWSEDEKKANYIRMTVPAAYRLFAYRYALQAWRISPEGSPEHDAVRRLYLMTLFDRTAHLNGLDEPLDPENGSLKDELDDLKISDLEQILDQAIEKEHYGAAKVAATLIGKQIADEENPARKLLNSKEGKPRSIVRAVACPDRRVRFAALESIMSVKPDSPYPGSSFVAEALDWFSRADGRRILIAAHPKYSEAAKSAGHFIGLGYQNDLVANGKEAMQKAASSPDVEMMLVDMKCTGPTVPILVQEMRKDSRTHHIPIAIQSDDPKVLDAAPNLQTTQALPSMERFDRLNPGNSLASSLSQIYPTVRSDDQAKWIEQDLLRKTGAEPIPPAIRLEQAKKSLQWLEEIVKASQEGKKVYHFENFDNIIQDALSSDFRLEQGLKLAAVVPSGAIQSAIYELIADSLYPMELREKAFECFKQSIDRFGVLIRGKQAQRLYDRYNASEHEPQETQELLGKTIDLIESKVFEKDNN